MALSPVYIVAGMMGAPDVRGFGVFWVPRDALAAACDMDGAFNRVALKLAPGASERAVVERLTTQLAPWGGREAHGRAQQPSHAMLDAEINEQRVPGTVLPSIFLGVAAFLLNVVVSRLVATQREQIAALKALGYPDRRIALHCLKLVLVLVLVIVAVGGALGVLLGVLLGHVLGAMLTGLYAEFFRFPRFSHQVAPGLVLLSLGTAALGTLGATLATLRLAPAAPSRYRRTLVERLGISGLGAGAAHGAAPDGAPAAAQRDVHSRCGRGGGHRGAGQLLRRCRSTTSSMCNSMWPCSPRCCPRCRTYPASVSCPPASRPRAPMCSAPPPAWNAPASRCSRPGSSAAAASSWPGRASSPPPSSTATGWRRRLRARRSSRRLPSSMWPATRWRRPGPRWAWCTSPPRWRVMPAPWCCVHRWSARCCVARCFRCQAMSARCQAGRPGTPCSWSAPAGRGWCRWCWPVATATRPGCAQAWRRARWSSSTRRARCATPASRARRPGVAQSVAVLTPPSFPPAAAVPLSRRQAQAALLALAGGLLPGPAWPAPAPDEPAVADWRQRFEAAVDRRIMVPVDAQRHYLELLQSALAQAGIGVLVPQALLLVDRSLQVQAAFVLLGLGEGRWSWLGATPVSTGRVGTFDHFRTPLGVFAHSLDNPDFRAEGTFNENHIRGYGLRGMRVFDFGWVQAERGWGAGGTSTMRLQMHATDPAVLEPRLGRAESKGCIRIPATLNSFIDRHGLLDSDYQAAAALGRAPWVLRADRAPIPWPGRYLVVVDSARSQRPPWAPGPATRR